MPSFARRMAITLLIPVALVVLGSHVPLPTGPSASMTGIFGNASVGIFALGIVPILNATWLVELSAMAIPAWRPLRRGDRAGRATLERASLYLGLVLAAVQTFGMIIVLEQMARASLDTISVPVVAATLLGGVCVELAAAAIVTRQGLMNGFVLILGVNALAFCLELGYRFFTTQRGDSATALGVLAILGASGGLLHGASRVRPLAPATTHDGPYRDLRRIAIARSIPLPASSLQPMAVAASLLSLATTLKPIGVSLGPLETLAADGPARVIASIVLTAIVAVAFTWLMHRPAELADVAARFENVPREAIVTELRRARMRAMGPTLLFFAAILVGGAIARVNAFIVVLLLAVALDLAHSMRLAKSDEGRVVVWEERRAAAVPILRAALACDGIPSEVRGMAYLSTFQIFAPYAPAQILVQREDEERARAIARHLALGDEAPTPIATAPNLPAEDAPWSLGRRGAIIGAALAVALSGVARSAATQDPPPRSGARGSLEIYRLDDVDDPFSGIADSILETEGVYLYTENPQKKVIHYLKIDGANAPQAAKAVARARAFMSTIALPPATHFALGDMSERDPDSGASVVTGLRSYLLAGEPFIRTGDIVGATAMPASEGGPPYVAIALSEGAAARFEAETRRCVGKRLAIVVDGNVAVAPIVRSAIPGGHLSLTLRNDAPDVMFAKAQELAARLRP